LIHGPFLPYHPGVAIRRNSRSKPANNARKKPAGKSLVWLFWFAFFAAILLLFIINRKTIRKTLDETGFIDRVTGRDTELSPEPSPAPESPEALILSPENETPPPALPAEEPDNSGAASPVTEPPPAAESVKPQPEPAEVKPAADAPAPKSVERFIYFIKFDEETGNSLRMRVSRTLPLTDSPLRDTLNALLRGPTVAEKNQKLLSLIPPGTRILSAQIRGSTAYINFSEDFQFNAYSTEGYAAQLQQLVWTITEFPNIADVQFLIEGRVVDYLGESIQIGGPLSRSFFRN
jgi:spore germination protein GerM